MKEYKIIKIKDCVDCIYITLNEHYGNYFCVEIGKDIPESGIHKDCKLEDYKKVKK